MTPAARVQTSIELLDAIIEAARSKGAPADRILADWFRNNRFAGSKDRRAIRELVYAANNGWQSRDWDFYGRIGLFDTAGLALREGENELIAVVSETFGGWGFMADLPDRSGLSID